jgi:transposase
MSTVQTYPSDATKEEFGIIREELEKNFKKAGGKKREVNLLDIFNGIQYVLKSGCPWRMLPHDFPYHGNVYYYYQKWTTPWPDGETALSKSLGKLVRMHRNQEGRKDETAMIIVDSKSVRNADTAKTKGYDGGKKVSGIKIHMGVDTCGLPHSIFITAANVGDRDGALRMISACKGSLGSVLKVLGDGGYTGDKFASGVKGILGENVEVEVVKRNEMHKFEVIPKRWVVERSFGWLDKCRRLWKNCERKINSTLHMVILAFIGLILKRF